jgi:2-polyprenyl-6-hydroxyphenyl methylase/3-demethylubiquinone-9 3-methyltransferase
MENIDHSELAKFALLAESWWDTEGECKPLHDLNPCRGEFVATRAELRGSRVLDVGCGGGILSEYLAAAGAEVTGIDANPDLIAVARAHALQSNVEIRYECLSIEALGASTAEGYDVITCMELLEHVPDPRRMIGACARCLRADGHLFLSTINRTPRAYALAVLGAEYVLKLLPRGTHDYARFIRPSELARWARSAGLEAAEFCGMSYNPITRRAALRDDIGVNYLAHLVPKT